MQAFLLEAHVEREVFLARRRGSLDVVPGVPYRRSGLERPFDNFGGEGDDYAREGIVNDERRDSAVETDLGR
jgi:hypothetical protein